MKIRISSPEWHKEMEERGNNPMKAWTDNWGFECKLLTRASFIVIVGLLLAYSINPFSMGEILPAVIFLTCLWTGLIIVRRSTNYSNNKELGKEGDYLWYRKWRKTQHWYKDVERINKEIFKTHRR